MARRYRRIVVGLMLLLTASSPQLLDAVHTEHHRHINPSTPTTAAAAAAAAAAGDEKDDDDDGDDDDKMSERLDDVLSSLDAAFRFMTSEARNMNLDAIIGTRMVQGLSVCSIHPLSISNNHIAPITYYFHSISARKE